MEDVDDPVMLVVAPDRNVDYVASRLQGSVVGLQRVAFVRALLNACIPTKSLVGSARTLLTARSAAQMGIEVDCDPAVDLDGLRAHKDGAVGEMVAAHAAMFAASGMDFILGTARFMGERTVEIATNDGATRVVRGRDVVINTRTLPAVPVLSGVAEAGVWNSETILRLESLPETLLILGGGYVGSEFASMFVGLRPTMVPFLDGNN
jgi:pyruvate/2-oxoglutarate dehydrogenase complex dihydrolipoamide dehydrogenase (E3) component